MRFRLNSIFLITLISSIACDGGSKSTPPANDALIDDEQLLPARIAFQEARVKTLDGFNSSNNTLFGNSYAMLEHAETMLKSLNDSKDVLISSMDTLTQPFSLNTSEPISENAAVSLTTPAFSIGPAGLSQDFLLLSSNARFQSPTNTIKTRFKTAVELGEAWLRAVQFSDQQCLYVSLQSVNNGLSTAVSNILVVQLDPNIVCAAVP